MFFAIFLYIKSLFYIYFVRFGLIAKLLNHHIITKLASYSAHHQGILTSYMNIPKQQLDSEQKQRKKTGEEVYFQGTKKNQLNDLKKYFKSILYDQNKVELRKQLIRRIINETTRGVDTSRLFPEMVLASSTKDLVEKKMIYFYLINFSQGNQNFARMAINTFLKDASSQNQNIRALSLRHLSNLRFKGREQYILPLLKKGIYDFSAIVKKSSIMGLTKLITQKNRHSEQPQRDEQTLNSMYALIRDPDSGVVCCALQAINEIQPEGLAMSKKLATYLLDNLTNFNEYQLPTILKYYELYEPKSEQQIVSAMNILYPKLKSSTLSVTLAVSKIYLRYAQLFPQHLQNILQRIKCPLLSFLTNDTQEVEFVALKHIQYIIQKYETPIFRKEIKKFFINFNESTYIKLAKLKIIELNIDEQNFIDMINQLAEYINEEDISKQALTTLERLMMKKKVEKDSKFIIKTVIKVIESTWNDYLCNNALPMIRNFLRQYSTEFSLFENIFYTLVSKATENQAKCSLIQIIGDYGQHIEDAIELIAWNEKQSSESVKISLLRANVKLFLKRPLQMLNMVSTMFNTVLNNDDQQLYVKDYAAFLYRGLENDIQQFKKLFLETRYRQQLSSISVPKLQINTLQIVYQKQEYRWIIQKGKYFDQIQGEMDYQNLQEASDQKLEQITEFEQQERRKTSEDIKNSINVDSIYRSLEADDFDNQFQIDAEDFETKWEDFQVGSSITRIVKNLELINQENLEQLFKIWHLGVMASVQDDDTIKLYLYCKIKHEQHSLVALLQFQVIKAAETMTLMVKSQDQQLSGFISKYIEQFLKLNEII